MRVGSPAKWYRSSFGTRRGDGMGSVAESRRRRRSARASRGRAEPRRSTPIWWRRVAFSKTSSCRGREHRSAASWSGSTRAGRSASLDHSRRANSKMRVMMEADLLGKSDQKSGSRSTPFAFDCLPDSSPDAEGGQNAGFFLTGPTPIPPLCCHCSTGAFARTRMAPRVAARTSSLGALRIIKEHF
jgi:hypothetical protein